MNRACFPKNTSLHEQNQHASSIRPLKNNFVRMKRIIGLFVFALFVVNTFAQNISQSNVPAVVLNAFQLKFPNADDVKWKLEKGNYRVDCRVNSKDNRLTMDYKGNVLKHSQDLYISEIPKAVLATIQTRVTYFDVNDADKLVEGGKITYAINFKIDSKKHYFWLDEKGKLLKYRRILKDSEVPASIMSLIATKYGSLDIDNAKYIEENGKINYILKGEINDMYHTFTLSDKATLLRHGQDLRNSEIPVPILNAVNTAYSGYEIRDADLYEEGGKAKYIIQLRKSKEKVYITFSPNGKILEVK